MILMTDNYICISMSALQVQWSECQMQDDGVDKGKGREGV
jgi:hypothetical protein